MLHLNNLVQLIVLDNNSYDTKYIRTTITVSFLDIVNMLVLFLS